MPRRQEANKNRLVKNEVKSIKQTPSTIKNFVKVITKKRGQQEKVYKAKNKSCTKPSVGSSDSQSIKSKKAVQNKKNRVTKNQTLSSKCRTNEPTQSSKGKEVNGNSGKVGKGKNPSKRTGTSKNRFVKSNVKSQRQKLSTIKESVKVISKKREQKEKIEKAKEQSARSNDKAMKVRNTVQNRKNRMTKQQSPFGEDYKNEPVNEYSGYFNFEEVHSFAGMFNPHSICPVTEDQAWIGFNYLNKIYLYNKNGTVEKTLRMPGTVDDIALRQDGGLLVTNFKGSAVWSVDKTFTKIKKEKSFEMAPMLCRGIDCLGNEIYICFVNSMSVIKDGKPSKCFVLKMSNKGQIIQKYSTLSNKEGFVHPYRIGLNVNGDVLVVDHGQGQLIIMDSNGKEKSRYSGHQSANSIYGVTCSADGFIFVADNCRQGVDVLYPDGRFCETLVGDLGSINNIKMDSLGDLWVGSLRGPHIRIFRVSRKQF